MSLLSYTRLHELIEEGIIQAPHEAVNASSIDITLSKGIFIELPIIGKVVDLIKKETPSFQYIDIPKEGLVLPPNFFLLGSSNEVFNLPNTISAEYKINSSLARSGLDHLNAGWCDAGWNDATLTLELKNCLQYQSLLLRSGMKIGQITFFEHEEVPPEGSYAFKGQYNGVQQVTESKGLRPVVPQPQPERRP